MASCALLLALATGLAGAQAATSLTQRLPSVVATPNRIEVAIPLASLDSTGCGEPDSPASGNRKLRLFWLVSSHFKGATYPDNHFMQFGVHFYLPESSSPLSAVRLDSALRAQTVSVSEAAGEPPMGVTSFRSTSAGARLVNGEVRLFVEGAEAVSAFLSARMDSTNVAWCAKGRRFPPSLSLPITHAK